MLTLSIFWSGVSYFSNNMILAVILYGLGWFVVGVVNVYAQTMVQILVPRDKLGSAMGAMVGISTFMAPLGALMGGALGEYLGSPMTILLASFIILAVAVYWIFNNSIRKLPSVNNFHEVF